MKNSYTNLNEHDRINKENTNSGGVERYRQITEQINFKPVTEEQFEKLTVPLKKNGCNYYAW